MKASLRFALMASSMTCFGAGTFSQELINIQVIEGSCDSLFAEVSVFFPFGSGNSCPSLTGITVLPGDVTAIVGLYYDVSGVWPQVGCTTTTDIAIPLPPGNPLVNLGTFNIMDGDTSQVVSDTLLQVCDTGTGIGEGLVTEYAPSLYVQGDYLVFTQVSTFQNARMEFFDTRGNLIRSERRTADRVYIGALPAGVYLVRSVDSMNTPVLRFVKP
ncbi:MAG: hypothetical protein M3R08_07085 [Bacteroidota bacterium]|nr:hypothetical protein [Bacteroidota bacterium]